VPADFIKNINSFPKKSFGTVAFRQNQIKKSRGLLIKGIVLFDDKIEIYYNTTDIIRPGEEDTHQAFFKIILSDVL
jgi:hypothetical protein